ncbi:4-hydroxy-tetrahydrodipicolinate reductase [Nonlabens ulvanivorans]|uniref:4-hydroxy-tetrahydrodipicolinate reductase n=1 Tax=Nonlabens ulvanivorans TaxID=906888 RepID=A0A090WHM9_NONUL|nr:4-hydroxy-tetrahydrodipicolinate reductase [Nonlabens ulvanivorans]GAL75753.1 4-hydroxy-tetrahydrodipicolinate reductase [Nonlabens ulvanivorans]
MKIALLGYGKMGGQTIERVALERGHDVVTRIGRNDSIEDIQKADVVIEFTAPDSAVSNIKFCADMGLPVVCGTTGWNEELQEVTDYINSKNGTLVHASNFSLGVNLFFELNRKLAAMMAPYEEYRISMEEIHHTEKKDAPSGTAVTLAQGISEFTRLNKWHLGTDSESDSLPIDAQRIEDVKGTHSIHYSSIIDDIEIKHTAHSRDGFAIGAVIAAEWITKHKGIFTMKDVLNLS